MQRHSPLMRTGLPAVVVAALSVAACTPFPDESTSRYAEVIAVPATPNKRLDLLFVVDDSASMTDKQAALVAAFPQMMDVLAELDGGLPDLHIGVVTSDLGVAAATDPDGATSALQACRGAGKAGALHVGDAVDIDDAFISDLDDGAGGRIRNYRGALRDVFAANALVGDQGCGFEQHLGAMARALTNPVNAGFLRADANLAVIIVADEDDCTAAAPGLFTTETALAGPLDSFRCTRFGITCDEAVDADGAKTNCKPSQDSPLVASVEPYIDALLATKADPRAIMVAAIAGMTDPVVIGEVDINQSGTPQRALFPSCDFDALDGAPSMAAPAVRIGALLAAFPGRSQLTSICAPDLARPLVQIGASAKKLVGDPCIETTLLADAAPALAGVQPTCEVVDVGADDATSVALPACTAGTTSPGTAIDCYELAADVAACPRQREHLRLRVRRAPGSASTAGMWTHVRCLKR